MANYFAARKGGTTPVGLYPPNPWGLFDMLGNVAEWCIDRYDPDCYQRPEMKNPQGPEEGIERVIRGGAFHSVADYIRSSARAKAGPLACLPSVGFRCVKL
jgi:iron(II)-dependent oxidoreductase